MGNSDGLRDHVPCLQQVQGIDPSLHVVQEINAEREDALTTVVKIQEVGGNLGKLAIKVGKTS